MTDFRPDDTALDRYNRALRQEARDKAVAEAEQQVALAWAAELVRMRLMAQDGLAEARSACQAAWAGVCAELGLGGPGEVAAAHLRLGQAQGELRESIEAARVILGSVIEELELISVAAERRESVARANRIRVWTAWCEAYETAHPETVHLHAAHPPEAFGRGGPGGWGTPGTGGGSARSE
jgi:hypothetical protein